MKNTTRLVFALLVAFIGLINIAGAQDTVLTIPYNGRLDSIHSVILKQKRLIQVFTPSEYKPGSVEKYDVIYVFDGGNWNTGLIRQVQRFLEGEGNVPPTIIVSVMGIDRIKDFTPTHLDDWKTSGGAENFLGFIKNELIPHINKMYPSNGDNTLWGHSLGGMFVMYAMLKEPGLSKSYIAVDPSIWWDKCYVAKMATSKLDFFADLTTTLFISGREGEGLKDMKIDTLDLVLKKMLPENPNWKLVVYPDESHSSVRLKSTYDAFKFIYSGLTADIQFHPMNGIVLKDKPIKVWYFDDTTKVRYTLDGRVPTTLSANAKHELIVTNAAKVTYRKFTSRSTHDKSTSGEFVMGGVLKPVARQKKFKPGGFSYSYYEGDWNTWPDLKSVTPVKTGVADKDFDLDKLPRKNNFALVVDGFIEIKEDGYYMFLLDADKNSKLYLGNKLLVQWDGNYTRRTYSYMLPLSKGFYPLRVEYLHKTEDFKLRMSYLTPSIMNTKNPVPIPVEVQYRIR